MIDSMRILIACEESQVVTKAFRNKGHEAYSCDIIDCSGGHPEWHIKADVLEVLKIRWDMIIGFPPCTYTSNAGACRLYPTKGVLDEKRLRKGLLGKEFFMKLYNSECKKIVLENPVSSTIFNMPQYTQEIQPHQHGHPFSKKTRLWIKGVEPLKPSHVITSNIVSWVNAGSKDHNGNPRKQLGKKHTALDRSKTFPGIADAMAEQWG